MAKEEFHHVHEQDHDQRVQRLTEVEAKAIDIRQSVIDKTQREQNALHLISQKHTGKPLLFGRLASSKNLVEHGQNTLAQKAPKNMLGALLA